MARNVPVRIFEHYVVDLWTTVKSIRGWLLLYRRGVIGIGGYCSKLDVKVIGLRAVNFELA